MKLVKNGIGYAKLAEQINASNVSEEHKEKALKALEKMKRNPEYRKKISLKFREDCLRLIECFEWGETDEGSHFWDKIHSSSRGWGW